jgi:hypothetical protein
MVIRAPTLAGQIAMGERRGAEKQLVQAQAKDDQWQIEHWQAEIVRLDRLIVREGGDPPL